MNKNPPVTQSKSAWNGLSVGGIDTRRVSASARWNWFWAVMPPSDPALILQLSAIPDTLPALPRLRNLEASIQTLPTGPVFYIRLKDHSQIEPFESLCRDVLDAGEQANTESDALERAIGRTFRWQYLLRGGRPGLLSEEEQKGLIGEIEILKLLIDSLDAKTALLAWIGPSGAPKDFELQGHCIEVKARRVAAYPKVKISNEHQLADVPGRRLWLSVLSVDKASAPQGQTLADYVRDVAATLREQDPSTLLDLDMRLADTGFDSLHDYSPWRWTTSPPEFYAVHDDFPRIVPPLSAGVENVAYSISLTECRKFRSDWESLKQQLINKD